MDQEVECGNCQACGAEALLTELVMVKLGALEIKICQTCENFNSAEDDLKESAELIISTFNL